MRAENLLNGDLSLRCSYIVYTWPFLKVRVTLQILIRFMQNPILGWIWTGHIYPSLTNSFHYLHWHAKYIPSSTRHNRRVPKNSLISRWVEENIFVGLNPVFLVNSNRAFKRARIHPPPKKNGGFRVMIQVMIFSKQKLLSASLYITKKTARLLIDLSIHPK